LFAAKRSDLMSVVTRRRRRRLSCWWRGRNCGWRGRQRLSRRRGSGGLSAACGLQCVHSVRVETSGCGHLLLRLKSADRLDGLRAQHAVLRYRRVDNLGKARLSRHDLRIGRGSWGSRIQVLPAASPPVPRPAMEPMMKCPVKVRMRSAMDSVYVNSERMWLCHLLDLPFNRLLRT
jgi:hypothetical protein